LDAVPLITDANFGSRIKGSQGEIGIFEFFAGDFVTGQVDLESMVEQKAIELIGFKLTSWNFIGFEYQYRSAGAM
jgi:hypothetical protein